MATLTCDLVCVLACVEMHYVYFLLTGRTSNAPRMFDPQSVMEHQEGENILCLYESEPSVNTKKTVTNFIMTYVVLLFW